VIAALFTIVLSVEAGTPYAWPLDLPQAVTSSFAEYRTGRFHAGIDLRTGDIGKPVRAADSGYVWRVGCSPWGYGKVVYLRLDDGRTVVYGHLDDYMAPVREYVRQAQHKRRNYRVDLYPEANQFRVERGEVIAFSGQTGVGVPHLHYEIRDSANRPVNPRLLGISWPDATCPIIRKLAVFPAGPDSHVNGDMVPLVLDVTRTPDGDYTCGPIEAAGRIGFGVDVIDPANGGESKLGIHVLRASTDGAELFRLQHDRMSYADRHNGGVAYHPMLLERGRFLLLWRWPGNVCEICNQTEGDGWWTVPEGSSEVRIEAIDFFGNMSSLVIPVIARDEEAIPTPAQGEGGRGAVRVECVGTWLTLTATFTQPEAEAPDLTVDGSTPAEGGSFRRVDATTFRAGYLPGDGVQNVTFRVDHPRMEPFGKTVSVFHRGDNSRIVPLGDVTIHVRARSPYGLLYAASETPGDLPATPLPTHGPAYRIWPGDIPIDQPVEIGFPLPQDIDDLSRIHVYRARSWGWACESAKRVGNRLMLSTRNLGAYVVMEDIRAPAISNIRIGTEGAVTGRRPPIRAQISDLGSGIASADVTCGSQWLLMEYDPEQGTIVWIQDEDLPAGKQEVLFRVVDGAGNTTVEVREVAIPGEEKEAG
jgi:hypothetical protein